MTLFQLTIWCWVILFGVWLVSAFFTKRTVSDWPSTRRVLYLLLLVFCFGSLLVSAMDPGNGFVALGFTMTFLGLVLAVWARATIGRNWSASIALKEDHKLVTRGPYAFVRHPIYSAILLMYLGTALVIGTPLAFVGLPIVGVSFFVKLRWEEVLMRRTFPDTYPAYARGVKRLIPFLY